MSFAANGQHVDRVSDGEVTRHALRKQRQQPRGRAEQSEALQREQREKKGGRVEGFEEG